MESHSEPPVRILVESSNSKLADVCRVVVEVVMRKLVKRTELARRHHSTSVSVVYGFLLKRGRNSKRKFPSQYQIGKSHLPDDEAL
jgi:hypothetical protein